MATEDTYAQPGYYDVNIVIGGNPIVHRVFAQSDYAAAVQVRKMTGIMPASHVDVEFVRSSFKNSTPGTVLLQGNSFDGI